MSSLDVSTRDAQGQSHESGNGAPRSRSQPESARDLPALVEHARNRPESFVREFAQTLRQNELLQKNCAQAVHSAEQTAKLLADLVHGNAAQYHLEMLRETPAGPRAVCRVGENTREFSLHPDVNAEDLRKLAPWEYVCVHEGVVIGVWAGDDRLFEAAHGEIVSFRGYHGDGQRMALVSRAGNVEGIVQLAPHLHEQPLPVGAKLVLLHDNPRWAISSLPANQAVSRFEVPAGTLTTRLSELACIDSVAEKLMLEIVKRVIRPEIRDEYNLDPLRGMILYSYRPGMGKTALMRAFAHEISELGQELGFDVLLYLVQPNEFKSMWHGEDARIVREELFGAIRERRRAARTRPLLQLVVMDEVDTLGRRPEARDAIVSSAQSDALEAFLAEADGIRQETQGDPPAHLLMVGMTNRPERLDDAIKRPGRLGDEVIELPDLTLEGAEQVCLIYLRAESIPWLVDGEIRRGLPPDEVLRRYLRPALAQVFPAVVLRYATDTQKKFDVTAGQALAAVHYRKAMSVAKDRAAERRLRGDGAAALVYDDVVEGLLETALSVAAQMAADPHMLVRHLQIKVPVARIEVTPRGELEPHRYVRMN